MESLAANGDGARARPSLLSRALRASVRALLLAFAFGFAIGTLLRCELERSGPPALQYLGEARGPRDSGGTARPGDVGDALTGVLVARDDEEQIG